MANHSENGYSTRQFVYPDPLMSNFLDREGIWLKVSHPELVEQLLYSDHSVSIEDAINEVVAVFQPSEDFNSLVRQQQEERDSEIRRQKVLEAERLANLDREQWQELQRATQEVMDRSRARKTFPVPETEDAELALELAALNDLKRECHERHLDDIGVVVQNRLTEVKNSLCHTGKARKRPTIKLSGKVQEANPNPHKDFLQLLDSDEDHRRQNFAETIASYGQLQASWAEGEKEKNGHAKEFLDSRLVEKRWSVSNPLLCLKSLEDLPHGRKTQELFQKLHARRMISHHERKRLARVRGQVRIYGSKHAEIIDRRKQRMREIYGEAARLRGSPLVDSTMSERWEKDSRDLGSLSSSVSPRSPVWKQSWSLVYRESPLAWDSTIEPALQ